MMSLPSVTLKKSNAVAVLGIAMAGAISSLKGVTGSVEEPLVQGVKRESCVGSVSMLVVLMFGSCELSESSSAMVTSSTCWRGCSEMVPSKE